VGFTPFQLEDQSRRYGERATRPIDVSLWYPIERGSARKAPIRFSEYVVLYTKDAATPAARIDRYRRQAFPNDSEADFRRLLESSTFAHRGARQAPGRFPLIIYAPGYAATPLTHTPTAEYLASHGYIVAMSPSQGQSPSGMTFDIDGQEQQIRDIELTLGSLRARAGVDRSRIALIGFSFGGGSAVLAAMHDPEVRAVVSLDGTIAFDHTTELLRTAPGYDPAMFRIPLLVLKREVEAGEDLSIVRSLALSDRLVLRFKEAQHLDFIASPNIKSVVRGKGSPADAVYPLVARNVLWFLDDALQTHSQKLDSREARVRRASSELRLPKLEAPSREELIAMALEEGGVSKVVKAQQDFARQAPGLALLSAGALQMLGLEFLDEGSTEKAIELYQFFVELYPRDFLALNLLGDLYRQKKQEAKATECYQRSLSIKADNGGAVLGLKKGQLGHITGDL
jgi:pimeloyl-ACP methyl ester carboxylesterase